MGVLRLGSAVLGTSATRSRGRSVSVATRPRRAWSSVSASEPTAARRIRPRLWRPFVQVSASFDGSLIGWDELIEVWYVSLDLSYRGTRKAQRRTKSVRPQRIASASLLRTNLDRNPEFAIELNELSADLGVIGFAIEYSRDLDGYLTTDVGAYPDILVASGVVVDGFWRGGQVGPALVFLAAELLRADAVFVLPEAIATRIGDDGQCQMNHEAPRPKRSAQAKVRSSWRRAGFRPLAEGVLWTPTTGRQIAKAHTHLALVEQAARTADARAWWRRRVRRGTGPDNRPAS